MTNPRPESGAKCSTCHRRFADVETFDKHRKNGQCVDPEALYMTKRNGIWHTG
jgi:hypothetical protein